jgi:ketosteroid isomerase-like protein
MLLVIDDERRDTRPVSQDEEALVRQAIRAVNESDVEAIVAMTGPDAEYEMIGGFADLVGQTILRGPDGVRRFYTDWFTTFTTTHVEPTAFLPAADGLLVLSDVEVTAEGSDVPVKLAIGQIYSFKDGCIHRVASYYDPQEALAAAGRAAHRQA